MKQKGILTLFAFLVSLFFAASTFAAEKEGMKTQQQKTTQQTQSVTGQGESGLYSANWLIGHKVVNTQGQDLGEITDVILKQDTGEAAYVAVSWGGFMNFAEERKLVPYKALKISGDQAILNVDKAKLTQAPALEQGLTVEEFDRRSSEFFGVSPLFE